MESAQDKLVRYLDDAWAVEKALVGSLGDMAAATDVPEVRAVFEEHQQVTRMQQERLEARLSALGQTPSGGKGLLNSIAGKLSELVHGLHDEEDKTTQNLIKGFTTENFETGMYQSLMAYASAIGDTETASLARELMQQEQEAAQKVFSLIAPAAVRPVKKVAQTSAS